MNICILFLVLASPINDEVIGEATITDCFTCLVCTAPNGASFGVFTLFCMTQDGTCWQMDRKIWEEIQKHTSKDKECTVQFVPQRIYHSQPSLRMKMQSVKIIKTSKPK